MKETVAVDQLRAKCAACSHEFTTIVLPDMSYGDFVMRSFDGSTVAILHALENTVFDEVSMLVKELAIKVDDEFEVADIIHAAFGIACDPVDGKQLCITHRPVCGSCGSGKVDEWDFSPPRTIRVGLDVLTHKNWLDKTPDQRKQLVAAQLKAKKFL